MIRFLNEATRKVRAASCAMAEPDAADANAATAATIVFEVR